MSQLLIHEETCTGCGICKKDCGLHLKGRESESLRHVDPDHPRCDGCLHCYAVCPTGAIQLREEHQREGDEDSLYEIFTSRRSVRHFREEDLPEQTVRELIDAASQIPSGGNRHPVNCIVLGRGETRTALVEELKKYYRKVLGIMNNPLLRNVLALISPRDIRSFFTSPEYRTRLTELLNLLSGGQDPLFYHAPVVLLFHSEVEIPTPKEDCILAAYNAALRAHTKGLGSCYVSLAQKVINKQKSCRRILGLGKGGEIHAVLLAGKPAVRYTRSVRRKTMHSSWL